MLQAILVNASEQSRFFQGSARGPRDTGTNLNRLIRIGLWNQPCMAWWNGRRHGRVDFSAPKKKNTKFNMVLPKTGGKSRCFAFSKQGMERSSMLVLGGKTLLFNSMVVPVSDIRDQWFVDVFFGFIFQALCATWKFHTLFPSLPLGW